MLGADTVGVDVGVRSAAGSAGTQDWHSAEGGKQRQRTELDTWDIAESASPQY